MTSRDGALGAEPASAATESQGLASERSVRMRAYHARKHRLRSTPLTADDPRHGAWQRVLARATRTASGCLLWTGAGAKVGRGYGRIAHLGRCYSPHRVALEVSLGRTLAGDEETCHSCDVPQCVEPSHLFAGSKADNMRDGVRKGRVRPPRPRHLGERNGSAKLDAVKVAAIRRRKAAGEHRLALAAEYGVSEKAIRDVVNFKSWGHVPEVVNEAAP